ncbi:DinB family protein [Parasphingorhabdus flavimaris]|jgi:hypothetical protein|uniref:DinB family protein n=1 Tax=Parasphingorhabdus flavimaris TaxID=266812 RepID=UPI0030037976
MLRETLTRQYDMAAKLMHFHLEGLTTDECLWRPAPRGPGVHARPDGKWIADWPDREDYAIGPPTISWITWHIGYWLTMVLDHSFGSALQRRETIFWPGDADRTVDWIDDLEGQWRARMEKLDEADLLSSDKANWPFQDRPLADVVAWSTVELTKNASEIGYTRFLYASHHG